MKMYINPFEKINENEYKYIVRLLYIYERESTINI